jgi:hypothetical protein
MPEQITIESEATDDSDVMWVATNLSLTAEGEVEEYASPEAGEEGSPVAQALFMAEGLHALRLEGREMLVRRAPGVEWHDLLGDLEAALVDFFL